MAYKTFSGSTGGGQEIARTQQAADAPFLSAAFWQKDVRVAVRVLTTHKSNNGPYISARLLDSEEAADFFPEENCRDLQESVTIDGEEAVCVRIGNLAGITLARLEALAGAKNKYFAVGDVIYLTCTGITPPEKEGHSASPNFWMVVAREQDAPASKGDSKF
jgi:hypothetical protein